MHFNYFKCRRRNVIVPPGERNWTTCAGRRLKQMTSDPDMPTFQNEKEGSIFSKARRAEAWGSKGQKLRPKGPKGVAFLGRGWRSPSHQLGGLGEHCKLSQRDPGPSPGHQTAFAIFQVFRMASAMFTHTHTRLTALFPGLPGWDGTRKVNQSGFYWSKRQWQWHQLGHMQVCTSIQTDNRASTLPLFFYRPDALPAAQPTVSKHC